MDDKRIVRTLALLALSAVFLLPSWARKKAGPEAVWQPGAGEVSAAKGKCASSDPSKTKACFIGAMKAAGASKEALEFAAELPDAGYMESFTEGGPVGVAHVCYPCRANGNHAVYFVNARPDLIDGEDAALLPKGDLEKNGVFAGMRARSPGATLWPGDRLTPGRPSAETVPGGGVRFVVEYRIQNGCQACEELGTACFAFDFDAEGKFKGASLTKVEDARHLEKKMDVTTGLEFNIRLKSDPASGGRWTVTQPPDEGVIKFAWKLFNAPDPQNPDAGGEEIWGFKAVGKGTTRILLSYVVPSKEKAGPPPTAQYEVTVR